jgi:hypothetical protein
VLLGDDWFVERSAKQACEIVDRRLKGEVEWEFLARLRGAYAITWHPSSLSVSRAGFVTAGAIDQNLCTYVPLCKSNSHTKFRLLVWLLVWPPGGQNRKHKKCYNSWIISKFLSSVYLIRIHDIIPGFLIWPTFWRSQVQVQNGTEHMVPGPFHPFLAHVCPSPSVSRAHFVIIGAIDLKLCCVSLRSGDLPEQISVWSESWLGHQGAENNTKSAKSLTNG